MGQPNPSPFSDKAVAILRAVADEPATLAELVSRTGLPRATAHRLAVALEAHRLVRRTADGAWAPGPASPSWAARRRPADLAGRHLVPCATSAARAPSSTSATARRGSAWPPPSAPAACATPSRSAPGCP